MVLTHLAAAAYVAKSSVVMASFSFLQDTAPSTVSHGNSVLLEFFVGMAAVSMFIVAAVVLGVGLAAYKAQKELMKHVNDVKSKLMPLIASSHSLVTDLTPQIKEITGKVNEISGKVNGITGHVNEIVVVAKDKVNEFSPTISQANVTLKDILVKTHTAVDETSVTFKEILEKAKTTVESANQTVQGVNDKTRGQIDRVNGMVTDVLDATVKLTKTIEHGIGAPGRELASFMTSAKTTVDGLVQKSSTGLNGLVGKVATMFAARKTTARPDPAYRSNPATARYASAPPARGAAVVPVTEASLGPAGLKTAAGPGVPSGSGNGDPIL